VGKNPEKESAWRHIYYSGDINNFKVPRITVEEYNKKFGEYRFNRNWSDSAIKNTEFLFKNNSHDRVLEIGTFEGRYTLWLADNYASKIHTIDPFDSSVYKISQEIFNQVEQNWLNNLSRCKYKHRITFYKDYSFKILSKLINENKTFDFIYVDGYHKASTVLEDLTLSFKLLNHCGIMLIDDAVDWQARDYNTNKIINDATLTPKLAVDSFVQIYKNDIEVLQLPRNNQVAIRKIK
jgi:predicted O-methyltransferase YrrM